jgi:RNA polymerase sigma-70 factor (ECF subfamily)
MLLEEKTSLTDLSDEQVLVLATKTPSLFRLLIDRYEAAFLRKAEEILGPREEAKDVVIEAFTKIYFNAHRYHKQPGASFSSWAYKIVINTAYTHYRKLKLERERRQTLPAEWEANVPGKLAVVSDKLYVAEEVATLIMRLPAKLARLVQRYFIEGWSQQEIAASEGTTVGAVKTNLYRAKKVLQRLALARTDS